MSSADIRGMFAGLPGAHGIIEAALNGQGRVMTDDAAHPKSAAVLAGDFLFFGGEPSEELVRRALNAENRAWIVQGSSAFLALVQAQRSGTWSERIAFDPCRQPEDAHLTALLGESAAGRDACADWRGGSGVLPQDPVGGGLRESIHGG